MVVPTKWSESSGEAGGGGTGLGGCHGAAHVHKSPRVARAGRLDERQTLYFDTGLITNTITEGFNPKAKLVIRASPPEEPQQKGGQGGN